jgi:EAL and modified HD-GYP domain-containing signal transduction protein
MRSVIGVTAPATGVVVARRPIVDHRREIVAFELVYHPRVPALDRYTGAESGVVAVHELLRAHGRRLDDVVGDKTVFCDVDRALLLGDAPLMLAPPRTVIQVHEDRPDEVFLDACSLRKVQGYSIALHGLPVEGCVDDLLRVVDVVRLDVSARPREETAALVRRCRAHQVRVLAEGCDTESDLTWARRSGFSLFQGRAVQAPPGTATIGPSAMAQMQLGLALLSQELDVRQVEQILRPEPALVAQVLDVASVARHHGMRRQVRSVREAVVLMGSRRLQRWAAVAILSRHGRADADALLTALVRARTCELLADEWDVDGPQAFTAGLLSCLDLVLGIGVAEILDTFDLDERLVTAAFRRETALGEGITRVAEHQRAVQEGLPSPGSDVLAAAAASAFGWASSLLAALDGQGARDGRATAGPHGA